MGLVSTGALRAEEAFFYACFINHINSADAKSQQQKKKEYCNCLNFNKLDIPILIQYDRNIINIMYRSGQ